MNGSHQTKRKQELFSSYGTDAQSKEDVLRGVMVKFHVVLAHRLRYYAVGNNQKHHIR